MNDSNRLPGAQMGHSAKSKLQKGCGLCSPHKHRRAPQARKRPLPELRRIGRIHRVRRHDLGDLA